MPSDCIFFTCTHTHEGPELRWSRTTLGGKEPSSLDYLDAYVQSLASRVAAATVEAESKAQECTLTVNRAFVHENMNRRFFLNDDRGLFIPRFKDLTPIAYGHTDAELAS